MTRKRATVTLAFGGVAPEGQRWKRTNPGWPDPNDWVNHLHGVLSERYAIYVQEPDLLHRRNKAAAMLGQVISSLLSLPPFKNDTAHLALKDLLIFLSDLDKGRDHPWSAPVNFGGTSITTTAQGELKIWVRAACSVLKVNGFKPVEAYRRIASGLTSSGRTGRGGKPVRWQTVQTWCLESESSRDQQVREKLEVWWIDFRAQSAGVKVVDDWGKPVLEREIAGRFADLCWSLSHIRDRFISGISD